MCDHHRVYLVGHAGCCGEKTVGQPQRPGGQRWGCHMRTAVMAVCLLLRWYGLVAAQGPSLSLSYLAAPDGEALLASAPAQVVGWAQISSPVHNDLVQSKPSF